MSAGCGTQLKRRARCRKASDWSSSTRGTNGARAITWNPVTAGDAHTSRRRAARSGTAPKRPNGASEGVEVEEFIRALFGHAMSHLCGATTKITPHECVPTRIGRRAELQPRAFSRAAHRLDRGADMSGFRA